MATWFKLVLADMTIPGSKGFASPMKRLGYGAFVAALDNKLSRITKFIPKVFSAGFVIITPNNSKPSVSPDDAVVLIERSPEESNLSKPSRWKAINDGTICGMTDFGLGNGITAAVWLNRTGDDLERITNSVIHELAHAKSNLDEVMHKENPRGILAKGGCTPGRVFSNEDAQWISKYLPRQIVFDMKCFGGGAKP